ncbi:anhydro-N-acetylmuramic acid kinase [Myroides phaeus]|nr:anhydro-N-acetylmuramic acid kinase [Myroides phaeus]
MKKFQYNIIGVMSGTSLDGVDLVYVEFTCDSGKWSFKVLNAETVPYSEAWKTKLANAINLNREEIEHFDERYTVHLASVIREFIITHKIKEVDAVCSHGHTVFHKPDLGYTLQIGNLPLLSDLIEQKVVCDFRVQDVLLGGQGAPLVPIGDRLLFADYEACLNLGGFANVSYENNRGYRIAFDLVPVNTLLNAQMSKVGLEYDAEGHHASRGKVSQELLEELNALDYYKEKAPKSLGVEFVKTFVNPILSKFPLSMEDYLATLVEHIAIQTTNGLSLKQGSTVLVTGGGAHNNYLLHRIRENSPHLIFKKPDNLIIDFKEAIIFGFLGVLKIRDEVNCLASVTGAKYDHSSGKIYNFFEKHD